MAPVTDVTGRSDDPEDARMNKAERLALAGAVAPHLRSQSKKTASRRVGRLDKDGNVVGYTTWAEVQRVQLERRRIEIEVVDGFRPNEAVCHRCGLPANVRARARVAAGVTRCDKCTFLSCPDCNKPLPRCYSAPSMRPRGGGEKYCRACRKKRTIANLPRCADCAQPLSRNSAWQYRKNHGAGVPPRCGACSRKARLLPKPACYICSKPLARSALSSARAKAGKPPICRGCYRGEVRASIAREKIATDPVYAEKVRDALKKGHDRGTSLRVPRKTCGSCESPLGASASRPSRAGGSGLCRSCSMKYRWAGRRITRSVGAT